MSRQCMLHYVLPQPLAVRTRGGVPVALCWRGHWEAVQAVEASWRVTSCWWTTPTRDERERRYYRVRTVAGRWWVLAYEPAAAQWFLAQVLD